jgi:CobQ-like glutamine amidotransferase family enzyme
LTLGQRAPAWSERRSEGFENHCPTEKDQDNQPVGKRLLGSGSADDARQN